MRKQIDGIVHVIFDTSLKTYKIDINEHHLFDKQPSGEMLAAVRGRTFPTKDMRESEREGLALPIMK